MNRLGSAPFRLAVVLAIVAAGAACTKKQTTKVATDKPLTSGAQPAATPASDDAVRRGLPDVKGQKLVTAYFDYEGATLRDDAKSALTEDARQLHDNPAATVRLEGHADERGSTQYNVALGERRANAARNYLISLGVDSGRLSIVSYGKEKPADAGHDEAAWAKNRRVELTVTGGSNVVSSSK